MTHDRDFKRLVRSRMRKTGESYVSARAHLQRRHGQGRAASKPSGGAAMYPFDRFTDPAKRALTRAQFESEIGNGQAITTAHLLLGLLHDENTMAVSIVGRLAPELLVGLLHDEAPRLREAIERQPADSAEPQAEGPTHNAKRAIELAFAEAQLIGDGTVTTGHLLVGLLRMETSTAARALTELGVKVDRARAVLRELTESGVARESSTPERKPPDRDLTEWMEAAQVLARSEGAALVRIDHLLRTTPRSRKAMDLLRRLRVDLSDALAAVPPPPAELSEAEASLIELTSLRQQGARERVDRPIQVAGRPHRRVDDAERSAREERDRLYDDWIKSWRPTGRHQ